MPFALLLLLSQAPHPLASDDEATRLKAVASWAKSKKPQLDVKAARAVTDCVELPPVKESGCDQPAKLCRLHEGDDGSGGTRSESLSFMLSGHEAKPVRVWWSAAYEPPVAECEPPDHLLNHTTPEEREAEVAAWHQKHSKEYGLCLTRLKKKAAADAEEAACDLVLVNACRAEAFVTCTTKNLRKRAPQLEPLHRVSFSK